MKNFMGLDSSFVWWQGVVEDNEDPYVLGRCKVRILGFHPSADKNLVLTEHLPWAHPIFPINGRETYKAPSNGDWVMGFFRDGRDAQEPVMFGILPGVISESLGHNEKYFSESINEARHFEYAANNELLHDSVYTANTNVWWRVDGNIDSQSNNYTHWSNTDISLKSGVDLEANTSHATFLMTANSGASLISNSSISIDASNTTINLTAGGDVTAASNANTYPIVATFDDLYEKIKKLEADLAALAAVVASHSHD